MNKARRAVGAGEKAGKTYAVIQNCRYTLKEAGSVALRIYDLMGQQVRELVNAPQSSGRHQVTWEGRDQRGAQLANGVYFYELRAGEFQALRKMILMK